MYKIRKPILQTINISGWNSYFYNKDDHTDKHEDDHKVNLKDNHKCFHKDAHDATTKKTLR